MIISRWKFLSIPSKLNLKGCLVENVDYGQHIKNDLEEKMWMNSCRVVKLLVV